METLSQGCGPLPETMWEGLTPKLPEAVGRIQLLLNSWTESPVASTPCRQKAFLGSLTHGFLQYGSLTHQARAATERVQSLLTAESPSL